MDKLQDSKLALLIISLFAIIILFEFTFEFWLRTPIDRLVEWLVGASVCDYSINTLTDSVACDAAIERYRNARPFFLWMPKLVTYFYLSYFFARIFIGNSVVGVFELLAKIVLGLASLTVPFVYAFYDVSGIGAIFSLLPLIVGILYFVYSNGNLRNHHLQPKVQKTHLN